MIIELPTREIATHGPAFLRDCHAAAVHRTGGVMRFDTESLGYAALAAKYPDTHPQLIRDKAGGQLTVACKHWHDCGVAGGGCCAKGLYGGKPSVGVCLRECTDYDGPARGAGDLVAKVTRGDGTCHGGEGGGRRRMRMRAAAGAAQ